MGTIFYYELVARKIRIPVAIRAIKWVPPGSPGKSKKKHNSF
jgi:hypothetical protein